MRLLFVKRALGWPRAVGHDVHGYSMMQALARLGHEVGLLTVAAPTGEALDGLDLAFHAVLRRTDPAALRLSRWQRRFLSYWGLDAELLPTVGAVAADWAADAVVAIGLDLLPALAAVQGSRRVWYAADEAAWHHLTQLRLFEPATWRHLKQAAINALYEQAFAAQVDRVWVVSEGDRRAMRWVTGLHDIDLTANGVDAEHYQPLDVPQVPHSCVFWGRLDFGPNIQALTWFCRHVWPLVRRRVPEAQFAIYGRCPVPEVRTLAEADGITLVADVPDLRPEVARHPVVVLPFVSGGGIKNKLLEAAGLGKAIVCSPRACGGLEGDVPLRVARSPQQWVKEVCALWDDADRRRQLGTRARHWVRTCHTWDAAARKALAGLACPAVDLRETVIPAPDMLVVG